LRQGDDGQNVRNANKILVAMGNKLRDTVGERVAAPANSRRRPAAASSQFAKLAIRRSAPFNGVN
jgi:hypothetical protein